MGGWKFAGCPMRKGQEAQQMEDDAKRGRNSPSVRRPVKKCGRRRIRLLPSGQALLFSELLQPLPSAIAFLCCFLGQTLFLLPRLVAWPASPTPSELPCPAGCLDC